MKFNNSLPIYLQVVDDIKKQIILGKIKVGEKMLSTKELALKYQINPNTAARIYKELEVENICEIKRGLGSYVIGSLTTIENLKKEMAKEKIDVYIKSMKELGYNFKEIIYFINEREEEENDSSRNK